MNEQRRRRSDPLALAFVVSALVIVMAVTAYVLYRVRTDVPAPAEDGALKKAVGEVRKWLDEQKPPAAKPPPAKPAPAVKAPPPPVQKPPSAPPPVAQLPPPPPAAAGMRFDLVDARPMRERRYYDAGEAQGYQVLADERFLPGRIDVLREELGAKLGEQLAGKRVEVRQLISWNVRTPKARLVEVGPGMAPQPPEALWRIPDMRKAAHWAICDVVLLVDGHTAVGRGADGYERLAELDPAHRRAMLRAIDQAIEALRPNVSPVASERLYFPAPEANRTWRYSVSVEPPLWREAMLTYRTARQGQDLAVATEFRHAGGTMNFDLGVFAPAHPSHASVRFPGFFFHPAYFHAVEPTLPIIWEWPWQLPDGGVRPGRMKRYVGHVKEWTELRVRGVSHPALLIEATLSYVEDGREHASAKEILWYMPAARQVAKVVREGRTPDEGATRIVAELVEYH